MDVRTPVRKRQPKSPSSKAVSPQGREIGRPWHETPAILERLDEHARLALGLSDKEARLVICRTQGIDAATYYADKRRLLELAHQRAGQSASELVAQTDAWLRQVIAEADATARRPGMSHVAQTMAQANKTRAVEAFAKLHGLNRPAQQPIETERIIREYHIIPSPKVDIDAVLDAIDAEARLLPEPEGD